MCGLFFWGLWWIFPLVGFLMCLGFIAFRFLGDGRGFMCMGGHRPAQSGQRAESHG